MAFTPEQRLILLTLARHAIEAAVCGRQPPSCSIADPALTRLQGAFVTILTGNHLRGCVGQLTSDQPLDQVVSLMAMAAASQDPRFADNPLRPEDLRECHIEISVLSPLERMLNPTDFVVGEHGIYLIAGQRTGCFLPQVAIESGWNAEQMLGECCVRKAGLQRNTWRDDGVELYRFTVERIEGRMDEKDEG
jgi:AmmeMemoRadiSam system protein A